MSGSNGQEGVEGWIAGFSGATVRYRRRLAVDRVTLGVPEGQVYALLGRNGAGKSSLMRCLLGQQRLTAGRSLLFGEDAWASRPRVRDVWSPVAVGGVYPRANTLGARRLHAPRGVIEVLDPATGATRLLLGADGQL